MNRNKFFTVLNHKLAVNSSDFQQSGRRMSDDEKSAFLEGQGSIRDGLDSNSARTNVGEEKPILPQDVDLRIATQELKDREPKGRAKNWAAWANALEAEANATVREKQRVAALLNANKQPTPRTP